MVGGVDSVLRVVLLAGGVGGEWCCWVVLVAGGVGGG